MPTDPTASPPPPQTWARWWNRTRYRLYAPVYDTLAWPMERGRQRTLRWLDPAPDARILLSGCGTGLDLKYLPSETQITALDAVPAMVRRAEARARTLGLSIDAHVGDAHALPFEDDSFDVVLLHLLLSVLPDPETLLAEAARVLAPGGRISIYDKFLPPDTSPSLPRRVLNPVARVLVSDFNRRLWPMLAGTRLRITAHRDAGLWGLYTASVARQSAG